MILIGLGKSVLCVCLYDNIDHRRRHRVVGGSGKNWKGDKECRSDVNTCIEF